MGVAFALASSLVWGTSDFLGGFYTRRLSLSAVTIVSQLAGFAALLAALPLVGALEGRALLIGVAAGACGSVGLSAFYRALATGTISIVSPVSACSALVPVALALAGGERPGAIALAGSGIALAGAVLASVHEVHGQHPAARSSIVLALVAALAIGGFLWFIGRAADGGHTVAAPSAGGGRGDGDPPPGARPGGQPGHVVGWSVTHPPLLNHDEERAPFGAAEHAGERGPVERDPGEDLPTLTNPHAGIPPVSRPDGAFGVDADPVRPDSVGPDPAVRQAAVGGDVEGGERPGERLGDHQRRVVGRHRHAVRKRDPLRHLACRAVRRDQHDDPRLEVLLAEPEADGVQIDVAAAVDHDLIPAVRAETAQVGVPHHGSVGLPAHQLLARHEKAAVVKPVDRPPEPRRAFGDDLAPTVEVEGDDLPGAPVGKPESAVVPAWRLADHESAHEHPRFSRQFMHLGFLPSPCMKTRPYSTH